MVDDLAPRTALDLGCSLGQLTTRLARRDRALYAMDLSPSAVGRARYALRKSSVVEHQPHFLSGSATQIPLTTSVLDLVIASDGPRSWDIGAADRAASYAEIDRVLRPGGMALFTEHLRPDRFGEFVDELRRSPLRIVSVTYLYH